MLNEVNIWQPTWDSLYRLIPSHFPPINLFEDVADPDDLDVIFAIESLTNDRLLDEAGDLSLVALEDRISGAGSTPVMAAFTHKSATRFSDGKSFGIYYGADTLKTAIEETKHSRALFMSYTNEPDSQMTMRCYKNKPILPMHDIRGHHYLSLQSDNYTEPRSTALKLRNMNSNGLIYTSARNEGGECIAAFKPKAVSIPVQKGHYQYIYCSKTQTITSVLKISLVD